MLLYTDLCYLYKYIIYYYYIVNIISIILQELQYSKDKGRVPLRTQNKEEGRGSSKCIWKKLIWYVTFTFLDSLFYVYFIRGSAQPNCLAGQPVFGRASETTQCIHWEFLDVTIAIYYK